MTKSRSVLYRASLLLCLATGILLAVPGWAQPQATRPDAAERAAKQRDALVSKMWWNQSPKIEELKLSSEQRGKMDAELLRYLEARNESLKAQREALAAFGEAMNRNDKTAAEALAKKAAAAASLPVEQQLSMMTTVVGMLSADQYKQFTERYPNMLSRLWIRQSGPRMNMARGSAGKRPR